MTVQSWFDNKLEETKKHKELKVKSELTGGARSTDQLRLNCSTIRGRRRACTLGAILARCRSLVSLYSTSAFASASFSSLIWKLGIITVIILRSNVSMPFL